MVRLGECTSKSQASDTDSCNPASTDGNTKCIELEVYILPPITRPDCHRRQIARWRDLVETAQIDSDTLLYVGGSSEGCVTGKQSDSAPCTVVNETYPPLLTAKSQ